MPGLAIHLTPSAGASEPAVQASSRLCLT